MFIIEMDAQGNCVRAEDPAHENNRESRVSISSDASFSSSMDEESYATAQDSLQRQSISSTGESGLGISGYSSRRASAPQMGAPNPTITAAAAAAAALGPRNNWPGGVMRQMDIRVESRELLGLDAELRRRSRFLPRESQWRVAGDYETISELTSFLRNVTPPPSNFMSLTSPTTSAPSSMSSLRGRKSGTKQGALKKMVRLFRRGSKKKKAPARPRSRSKKRPTSPTPSPLSPGLSRSNAIKVKRPPRIRLPDTAVAGRTVDGHRHIAISIPIEHAHLGPEAHHYGFPSPPAAAAAGRHTRSHSMSSADTPSPRVYNDINYNVRPLTAFAAAEPHIGTQLGPLVEERESLSSRSWERGSSNGSGQGEAAIARKVRLASRNTFGTVHEEQSRPNTSSGIPQTQATPPRTSNESGGPRTPKTSDEVRSRAHREALAALAGGGSGSGSEPPSRPATAVTAAAATVPATATATATGQQRPVSAHSLRAFASSSPNRVYYPMRKSSLHSSGAAVETRRPRTMSNTTGGTNNSRDSSQDQTMQESSIFSDRSYLESLDTVYTGTLKEDFRHSPVLVSEAMLARRVEGPDVVDHEPRSSMDSQRRKSTENRKSGSSYLSASSREKRRTSGSPRGKRRGSHKGKERESWDGPVVIKPETEKKRSSGSSSASASAILRKGKSKPAPVVVTIESAGAVVSDAAQQSAGEAQGLETPRTPTAAGRRSKFVEDLAEAPLTYEDDNNNNNNKTDTQAQAVAVVEDQQQVPTEEEPKGKGKETQDQEADPPSIEVQQPSPTESEMGQMISNSPARDQSTSLTLLDEPYPGPDLGVPMERRAERKDKGKQREASPVQPVEEAKRPRTPDTPDGQSTEAKNTSPIPSPRERRDRRKTILLSRKERVAELRAALEKPGSQPSDLLWERRLSTSSASSSGSTLRAARMNKKRESFPYAPAALAPMMPRTAAQELSFTDVLTVAEVQPSSPPDFDLVSKASTALSVSSPITVTAPHFKTSPIPPYRSFGSVTPPDSPTNSLLMRSPSSQLSTADSQGTLLRHLPSSPFKGRITRRRSGRSSPSPSSGRSSPVMAAPESSNSLPRPKTAGKGALASRKAFFEARAATPPSDLAREDSVAAAAAAGPSAAGHHGKSILNMSRGELFDRYEALREKQTRDMEKRLRHLERNGEAWLTSMLPILRDMSQTLKIAVGGGHEQADRGGKGKGKAKAKGQAKGKSKGKGIARERTPPRYDDGRQSRFADRDLDDMSVPRTRRRHHYHHEEYAPSSSSNNNNNSFNDSFDCDESVVHHSSLSSPAGMPPVRPRLYLHDDATLGPASHGYPLDRPGTASSSGPSFSMLNVRGGGGRGGGSGSAADMQQQSYSASTTMVDSGTAPAASSFAAAARPVAPVVRRRASAGGDLVAETDRLAHLEKLNERIDAEMRRFPLVPTTTTTPSQAAKNRKAFVRSSSEQLLGHRRLDLSEGSEESLRTYRGTLDAEMRAMEDRWGRRRRDWVENGDEEEEEEDDDDDDDDDERQYLREREDSVATIEPLMRELQMAGSRISLESPSSDELGDDEVRRLRQKPGPRAVVGFGAFSM